jgi:hypothetical protein
MKYIIAFLLLISPAYADNIMIGFVGRGGQFDHKAFKDYANKKNLKPVVMYNDSRLNVINMIVSNPNYELYGYSKGAATVSYLMSIIEQNKMPKPKFVTTVGAFRSTDVDFRKYNIKFVNYFDDSGKGQKSPGQYVKANHSNIMRYVADNY